MTEPVVVDFFFKFEIHLRRSRYITDFFLCVNYGFLFFIPFIRYRGRLNFRVYRYVAM